MRFATDRQATRGGGGGGWEPWWWQTAAWKQLSSTLKEILVEARAQRLESGRCGKGRGGREVAEPDSGRDGPQYAGTDAGDVQVV